MLNMVIFSAVGVFASLFMMIASHFNATPTKLAEFTPSHVIAKIEQDTKTNFIIAKQEGRLPENAKVIAKAQEQNWQIFSVAPEEEKKTEKEIESVDFNTGFFSLVSHFFSSL